MGGPPSIQRLLSMIWLGNLMYPDVFDYGIDDRVREFYSLFFKYDLTDAVQRLLSMIWLGNLMYPDVFDYGIDDRVREFYSLFFRYDLTDADLNDLMVYAKPAPAPASAQATTPAQAPAPLFGVFAGIVVAAVVAGRGRNR